MPNFDENSKRNGPWQIEKSKAGTQETIYYQLLYSILVQAFSNEENSGLNIVLQTDFICIFTSENICDNLLQSLDMQ